MRAILTGLVLLTMVAGCASPQPTTTPPVSAAPSSPSPAPTPTTPPPAPATPPRAERVPVGKLSPADVAYVVVSRSAPDKRSALLWPATHAAPIAALVNAFNTVEFGRREDIDTSWSASVSITLKHPGSQGISLSLHGQSGSMVLAWDGQPLLIDSPALAQAVAALDPLLQPLPKPGSQIWAVDPMGSKPPELLLTHEQPIRPEAFSSDGRYWLLTHSLSQGKGDFSAVPYLLDRTTGALREGARTEIRNEPAWSGNGFFINWPAHLNLALKEDPMPALRKALGVEPKVREVVNISFTSDGKRFAALVGHPRDEKPLDLVLGNTDGTALTVVPGALTGTSSQVGMLARATLSPDGERLVLAGKGPALLMKTADAMVRERWTQLAETSMWIAITWSPDSRHVALLQRIYDQTGRVVREIDRADALVWRPDSEAVAIQNYAQVQILGLDGTSTDVPVPDWSVPAGFLPDGRLLVFRTIYPDRP